MRILILTMDFPPRGGGISRYTHQIASHLAMMGDDIIVFAPWIKGTQHFDQGHDFTVVRFRPSLSSKYTFFCLLPYLLYVLTKNRIDRVYATSWFPMGILAFLICKMPGTPYFVALHGYDFLSTLSKGLARNLLLLVLENAHGLTVNSSFVQGKILEARLPSEKIFTAYVGVDTRRFVPDNLSSRLMRQKYGLEGKRIILTVGHLRERKGQDMVLRSFPRLVNKIPEVHYLIVGEGPDESRLKHLAHSLGLEGHVTFAGFVSEEELPGVYNACDVFVMPSREIKDRGDVEGFGIVYLEANACGKPVVGGDSGGVRDAIIPGQTGLLIDPTNAMEISEALERLLTDQEWATRLGVEGRRRAEEMFTWEKVTKRVRDFLRQG